jgi:MFS family permease
VALGETVSSLIPVYVRDVLDTDPAQSVYIFAPAGLGYLAGTVSAPWLMKKFGQRRVGFGAFLVTAIGVMMFGFVDALAPFLAPISPTRLFNFLPGVDLSDPVLAAGFIAMPANYGSTATSAAVQNFINARVPLINQGGVFGMEKVVDNILTIVAVLSMGALATAVGTQVVMVIVPLAVFLIVVWLIRYSVRTTGQAAPGPVAVVEELWSGPAGEEAPTEVESATGEFVSQTLEAKETPATTVDS